MMRLGYKPISSRLRLLYGKPKKKIKISTHKSKKVYLWNKKSIVITSIPSDRIFLNMQN